MENEELFKQIVEQNNRYIDMLTMQLDRAERLLEQSENRIDRTNAMIEKFAECSIKIEETMKHLTLEYSKHLDTLTGNRDEIVRQNSMLISLIKEIKQGIQLNQHINQ